MITSQGDTDITIPDNVPPGRREVVVSKSGESGGLGISIKVRNCHLDTLCQTKIYIYSRVVWKTKCQY